MSEAPERMWAQDAQPDECDYTGGGWWDDECRGPQYSHMVEYVRADIAADTIERLTADRDAGNKREADANKRAMENLRRAEKAEIASKNHAAFSHEWRQRAEKAEAERGAILSSGKRLVEAIEGWSGLTTHGTFRAEKSNLRLKDTSEWAAFYHAVKQPHVQRDTQKTALADALQKLADCVDDGCFCSEVQMATAMDDARAALAQIKGGEDE